MIGKFPKIGPRVYGGFDADAQAFITAASITDPTQQSAINTLVVGMKNQGLWTKMKAVYPFVGGTASSHKFNLINPVDSDAAFRLVFNGGWTHSATGVLPNGTNAFANTFLNPTTSLTSSLGLSYYSRTNANTGLDQVDIGVITGSAFLYLTTQYNASGLVNRFFGRCTSASIAINSANADARGYYYLGKTGNGTNLFKSFKNGLAQDTQTGAGVNPTNTVYVGAANVSGSPAFYTNRECAFATITDGLTDTDASNLYTLVQAFQTTLGRSVGTQTVSDADAQAFVTAADIQDQVQADAINNLVIGMKAQSLWTKMKAVYPFVGGTASSHKFNLKDPRDLDAAFRLSFSGGLVHASTGILPNGTNGYADTFITANSVLTSANWHLSYYSRTNNNTASDFDMGCGDSNGFYSSALFIRRSNNTVGFDSGNATSANRISASSQTDSRGYYIGSIRATNDRILIKNGSNILASSTANNSNALYSLNITLFAYNQPPVLFYGSKECAFASIGDGLTNTDASNLYTLVQAFQTSLSRQV